MGWCGGVAVLVTIVWAGATPPVYHSTTASLLLSPPPTHIPHTHPTRTPLPRGFLSDAQYAEAIDEIVSIPAKIESIVAGAEDIFDLSRAFRFASSFLFLGRGYNFPVALEGALKLKVGE